MKNQKSVFGFTLIELLVVVAIIGLLASVILASLNTGREKAQIAHAKAEIAELQKAIGILSIDTGVWPEGKVVGAIESGASNEIWDLNTDEVGLVATDGSFAGWGGPYISTVPLDPWGSPYFLDTDYLINATGAPCAGGGGCVNAVALGSFGPDGNGQNVYNADDIILILAR